MSSPVDQLRSDYDEAPYDSHAFPQSAPEQLAAIAYLFGLQPPPVADARVLEIGCAAGGNLIPFATGHPGARAVGIDLSQVQIDQGRDRVQALGLTNLTLMQGDIAQLNLDGLGQFDYIVCHGVYSWVPDNVQEAILSALSKLLAPNGVAYLSYNVYPGWKAKEIIRDAMLLRGGGRGTPEDRLRYARGMINFLEEVAPADSVLAKAVADHKATSASTSDYYLLHEELERFNAPCYFLELLDRAGEYGLAYLAEAHPAVMFAGNYGPKVSEPLLKECGHSQALLEQYLDFVVNRPFRQTLLVHADQSTQIRYQLDPSRYRAMHFAGYLPPTEAATTLDDARQEYGQPGGQTIITGDPGSKAVLDALTARWPWTLSWDDLLAAARHKLQTAGIDTPAEQEMHLSELVDIAIVTGLVRYRLDPVSPEPSTSPLRIDEPIRQMAELTRRNGAAFTFNRWHESLQLSPLDTHLVPLLDGTRDRDALIQSILALAHADLIQFDPDGENVAGETAFRDLAAAEVDALPERLAAMKLLSP